MKKMYFLLFGVAMLLQSCWYTVDDDGPQVVDPYHIAYEPITQTRADFEETIKLMPSRPVQNAGKIYIKDAMMYINEKQEGFHVFDNTNPEDPQSLAFISIPGSTDLAIRGTVMYSHHLIDLVAFRYERGADELQLLHREQHAFPALISPEGLSPENYGVEEELIVVGYKLKED